MTCRIALGPNDDFELILPSGRRLYVPIENGTQYLKKILQSAARGERDAPGHIGAFPTQHVIDTWMKEEYKAKREAEAREAALAKTGIDISALDISL